MKIKTAKILSLAIVMAIAAAMLCSCVSISGNISGSGSAGKALTERFYNVLIKENKIVAVYEKGFEFYSDFTAEQLTSDGYLCGLNDNYCFTYEYVNGHYELWSCKSLTQTHGIVWHKVETNPGLADDEWTSLKGHLYTFDTCYYVDETAYKQLKNSLQ